MGRTHTALVLLLPLLLLFGLFGERLFVLGELQRIADQAGHPAEVLGRGRLRQLVDVAPDGGHLLQARMSLRRPRDNRAIEILRLEHPADGIGQFPRGPEHAAALELTQSPLRDPELLRELSLRESVLCPHGRDPAPDFRPIFLHRRFSLTPSGSRVQDAYRFRLCQVHDEAKTYVRFTRKANQTCLVSSSPRSCPCPTPCPPSPPGDAVSRRCRSPENASRSCGAPCGRPGSRRSTSPGALRSRRHRSLPSCGAAPAASTS